MNKICTHFYISYIRRILKVYVHFGTLKPIALVCISTSSAVSESFSPLPHFQGCVQLGHETSQDGACATCLALCWPQEGKFSQYSLWYSLWPLWFPFIPTCALLTHTCIAGCLVSAVDRCNCLSVPSSCVFPSLSNLDPLAHSPYADHCLGQTLSFLYWPTHMRTHYLNMARSMLSGGKTVIPPDVQVAVFMPPSLSLATRAVASCPACCPKQLKGLFLSQH